MTQANLNAPTIKKIKIPTPPRELQNQYETVSSTIRDLISSDDEEIKEFEVAISNLTVSGFTGKLTQSWREKHREELEAWMQEHSGNLFLKPLRVLDQKATSPEVLAPIQSTRRWLMDQLSNVQNQVYSALTKWQDVILSSEDIDRFLEECLIESSEDLYIKDIHDTVLRSLNQLAGLGLVTRVGIPNRVGEYITGYRTLREEELTKVSDLTRLRALS